MDSFGRDCYIGLAPIIKISFRLFKTVKINFVIVIWVRCRQRGNEKLKTSILCGIRLGNLYYFNQILYSYIIRMNNKLTFK